MCLPPTLCFDVIHSWTWSFDGDLTGTGAASCIVHCPKTEPEDTNIHKGTQNFEYCLTYDVSTKPNLQQKIFSCSKTPCCTNIWSWAANWQRMSLMQQSFDQEPHCDEGGWFISTVQHLLLCWPNFHLYCTWFHWMEISTLWTNFNLQPSCIKNSRSPKKSAIF